MFVMGTAAVATMFAGACLLPVDFVLAVKAFGAAAGALRPSASAMMLANRDDGLGIAVILRFVEGAEATSGFKNVSIISVSGVGVEHTLLRFAASPCSPSALPLALGAA